ncbi:MAG: ROK family protein, partial [Planctomycetaceae bacterium]
MDSRGESKVFLLGLDLGGTNIKAGVVSGAGESLSSIKIPTEAERGPDVGVRNITRAARKAVEEAELKWDDIRGVGLATPGTMDIPAGMLLDPPNLPGWDNFPIRERVQDQLDKPTILQNDANAAAYGEYWLGAARDANSLVFWTLGTGIGCGIIIGDMILQGEHSHGSECGHIVIEMTGGRRLSGTGQYGTLEAYAGAKAVISRCEEALDAGRESLIRDHLPDEELTPLLIARCAEAGDELANELVMDTARYLGVGTTTVMHTIDPDMVLFGGAMTFGRNKSDLGRRFMQRIREEVKARAFPVPYAKTKIDFATLGSEAGYIGAAGCARR